MKNLFLLLLITFSMTSYGQEDSRRPVAERKHEVKIGAIKLLAGPILEGTYEYIQNKDFTFGFSVLANLDNRNDYPEDFSVTPFARFYFQETKEYGARGFFVEGFGKYSTGRYDYDSYDQDKKYTAGGLGIALGKKWINNSGFVFEILAGAGRTIGTDSGPDVLFRGDFNIGYRF